MCRRTGRPHSVAFADIGRGFVGEQTHTYTVLGHGTLSFASNAFHHGVNKEGGKEACGGTNIDHCIVFAVIVDGAFARWLCLAPMRVVVVYS